MEKALGSFGACICEGKHTPYAPEPLQRTFLYSDRKEEACYVQHKVLRYIISHQE
jgi:hypothetical protein